MTKKKLNECITVSITNANKTEMNNITLTFDSVEELNQIISNAGLTDYVGIPSSEEEVEVLTVDDCEIISDGIPTAIIYVDCDYVNDVIAFTAEECFNMEPTQILQFDGYCGIVYSTSDMSTILNDMVAHITNEFPGMVYGSEMVEEDEVIKENAELNAAVPYEYDAEESPYNIKGPNHQMNLRYVPGIMADNPMVDELRESAENPFKKEIDKISDFVKKNVRVNDVYRSTGLTSPKNIDSISEDTITHKIANFMFGEYIEKEYNGEIHKTRLKPSNFVGIASQYFNKIKPQLEKKGFTFDIKPEIF